MPTQNLKLLSVVLTPVGTYNDQYLRSFKTNLTVDVIAKIKKAVLPYHDVTAETLSAINEPIIDISSTPGSKVEIPGGFNAPRCVFVMTVEVNSDILGTRREIISGYTDHDNNDLSKDMTFIVNSIQSVHSTSINSEKGVITFNHLVSNSNVLSNSTKVKQYMMRPQDLYGTLVTDLSLKYSSESILDTRNILTTRYALSARVNNSLSLITSKLFNSYAESQSAREDFNFNIENISNTLAIVRESDIEISSINFNPAGGSIGLGSRFNFENLSRVFPETPLCISMVSVNKMALTNSNDSMVWSKDDFYTKSATMIGHGLQTIMSSLGIINIRFTSTNFYNTDGNSQFNIQDVKFLYEPEDTVTILNDFQDRFKHEVLKFISCDELMSFDLSINADFYIETVIDISLDGKQSTRYVMPTFCDSLMSPVITDDITTVANLALDIENILNFI